jgi:hypothetical protein
VFDDEVDRRLAAALAAPVRSRPAARAAIMGRIRAIPAREHPTRHRPIANWSRRHALVGAMLAAGIGSVAALPLLTPTAPDRLLASVVIGDSVTATLRDTLRLVRLFFDAPAARRVAVVGDFNGWRREVMPLHRDPATHRWTTTLALHDGRHRYAFVVDGTRWAIDPRAPRAPHDDGRLASFLTVARATN